MYKTLITEYQSVLERIRHIEQQLQELPSGYISTKKINGRVYHYYQRRIQDKIVSKYLPDDKTDSMMLQIKLRKAYHAELKNLTKSKKAIESIASKLNRGLLSYFRLLDAAIGMDSLTKKERYESLTFADAMTAVEGVPASRETDNELTLWAESKQTYQDACIHILKQCGVVLEVN